MRRPLALPALALAFGLGAVVSGCTAPLKPQPQATVPPVAPGPLDQVRLRLTLIAGFSAPLAMAIRANDPAFYIAEQGGKVWALAGTNKRLVLDISTLTKPGGEQGLLGLAIAPDGTHLYLDYTDLNGNSNLDEYALDGNGNVDAATRRPVLFRAQPFANHNGGNLVFGPDGFLYIGFGDGGSGGDPQRNGLNLGTWLGKILRIDPRRGATAYSVPSDNPFVSTPGALPEIWSFGLRNPWRYSFDAATGDLWLADVGQSAKEEIDLVPAAQGAGRATNFGWSAYEGTNRYNQDQSAPGSWMPIYEYGHVGGACSITGGVRYRGNAVPALRGVYVYSDYCTGGINALAVRGQTLLQQRRLSNDPPNVASFGVDANGEVYALSLGGGLYRLDPG